MRTRPKQRLSAPGSPRIAAERSGAAQRQSGARVAHPRAHRLRSSKRGRPRAPGIRGLSRPQGRSEQHGTMHAEDIRAGSPTPTSPAPRRWQGERSSRCPTSSGCSCSCRRTTSPRSAPSRWRKQGGSLDSVRRAPGRLPPACAPSQSRGSSSSRGRNADLEAHIRPHLLRRDIQVPHQERQSACARLPQHRRAAGGRLRLGGRHERDPPCLPQRHTLGRQARSDLQALRDLARSRRRRPPLEGLHCLAVVWVREDFPDYKVVIVYHDDNAGRIPHAVEFRSVLSAISVEVADNSAKATRRDWVYSMEGHPTWRIASGFR